mmetsp:Transcript_20692/g.73096  ORF Transcript_20692/g.73096 Transcript_20692/m.73096 type:complete len:301 (+) Transcript_20692:2438-3340(+)
MAALNCPPTHSFLPSFSSSRRLSSSLLYGKPSTTTEKNVPPGFASCALRSRSKCEYRLYGRGLLAGSRLGGSTPLRFIARTERAGGLPITDSRLREAPIAVEAPLRALIGPSAPPPRPCDRAVPGCRFVPVVVQRPGRDTEAVLPRALCASPPWWRSRSRSSRPPPAPASSAAPPAPPASPPPVAYACSTEAGTRSKEAASLTAEPPRATSSASSSSSPRKAPTSCPSAASAPMCRPCRPACWTSSLRSQSPPTSSRRPTPCSRCTMASRATRTRSSKRRRARPSPACACCTSSSGRSAT